MSKLAVHYQTLPGWAVDHPADYNKIVDPLSTDPWPGYRTIGRVFVPDGEANAMVMRGAAGAGEWFNRCKPAYDRSPWIWAWEGPNEPPVATAEQRAALVAFTRHWVALMHNLGLRTVALCLGVGWPDVGTAADLAGALEDTDYWSLHEYSAPAMQSNASWYCLRYRRTVAELRAAGSRIPPLLITECGIDGGVVDRPKTGWKTFVDEGAYRQQLAWYNGELCKDDYVVAGEMYTAGPNWDWIDFEVPESLAQYVLSLPGEAGQAGDTGDTGGTATMERRVSEWIPERADGQGLNLVIIPYEERADKAAWPVRDGVIYRVKDVFPIWQAFGGWDPNPGHKWTIPQWARDSYLKPMNDPHFCDPGGGDHHVIVGRLDNDGQFEAGAQVFFWSEDGLLTGPTAATLDKYTRQNTTAKGWTDIAMAGEGGSSYGPARGEHGPYKVTVNGASDIIYGMGMPLNEHLSFVIVFQAEAVNTTVEPPVTPPVEPPVTPPVEPPASGEMLKVITGIAADVKRVAVALESSLKPTTPQISEFALARPLPDGMGEVSQVFGINAADYARFGLAGHNGLDYGAAPGAPSLMGAQVLACHAGRCEIGHDLGGFGDYVKVHAEGEKFYTLYAHLSAIIVTDNEHIEAGQQLGNVGSTGNSTGPHLHLGWKIAGVRNMAYSDWLDPVLGRKLHGDA